MSTMFNRQLKRIFLYGSIFCCFLWALVIYEFQDKFFGKCSRQREEEKWRTTWRSEATQRNTTWTRSPQEVTSSMEKFHKNDEYKETKVTEDKLVLLYTPIFGRMPWKGLKNSHDFTHWNGKPCPVTNCKISYNKSDLSRSDAVVFHGRDMLSMKEIQAILPSRNPKQRWVYFMQENPRFTFYDPAIYNGIFNWTMSYRRDSDFFVPYNYYTRLGSEDARPNPDRNYAEGKDKLIAWMVSHCGNLRDKVVRELSKFLPVDVYGGCTKLFNQTNYCGSMGSKKCQRTKNRHKFYLAFENYMCIDYVTEKYWLTLLESETIPVVLWWGFGDAVSIPGSYINALDFPSVRSLAEYLGYLDRNDTAYNEYFQWRKTFKVAVTDSWTCQMCAALHNPEMPNKVYDNLGEFWGINSSCALKPLRKFLRGK